MSPHSDSPACPRARGDDGGLPGLLATGHDGDVSAPAAGTGEQGALCCCGGGAAAQAGELGGRAQPRPRAERRPEQQRGRRLRLSANVSILFMLTAINYLHPGHASLYLQQLQRLATRLATSEAAASSPMAPPAHDLASPDQIRAPNIAYPHIDK